MTGLSPFDPTRVFGQRGFTLVEMLVAVAVLGLLVAMLAQTVALTGQAISVNSKKLDATGEARLVFDRLATDLAARPRRSDLGALFTKINGGTSTAGANDTLQFYSEVDGYSGAHQIAAVGYRIQQTTTTRYYQLERGAVGTDWGPGTSSNPFVQFLPNMFAAPLTADPNYDVLANGVFRLEFCVLLNTGVMTNPPAPTASSPNTDLTNVVGLIVAIGVLDANSLKSVSHAQLQQLAAALPDNTSGDNPLADWNTARAQTGFASGIPPQIIQSVRLYQRTFYVP